MQFGDYIVYVDESGDHSMTSIDENYPIFSLAFCVFKKSDYVQSAVPAMQDFKFRWFGHDTVVMHEADIVKRRGPFHFLQYDKLRERFMADLTEVIERMPMTVISSVIRKDMLKRKYVRPENPYQLGLLFCMEMTHSFIKHNGNHDQQCHIVCESRSPREKAGQGKEDGALELEFRRIAAGDHFLQGGKEQSKMPCFDLVFASKLANSTGLQIADLIARPIGLRILKGGQPNRAFDVINQKFWRGPTGRSLSFGLKVFP
ncbi:DUF3800 domain-containing protein [Rhizobium sp. CNPSo 4062]|uniref:DUF3800 domain-containing protein n=1 Tax=Rhizobium sp. CNPSo 4062 TaxID=3021410 RepID=UPI000DE16D4D|nr:DUF3800 domain-containing protein [Rhizobium sp. CNPSo 4062]MDK4705007.1 DUF3800 domain-containing protein [Rhizobium sp. CNPSo 4062]